MSDLSPGFADPVTDAQRCFRAVLQAMSRPGQLYRVSMLEAPAPLAPATAAVVLTLADQETPLWIDAPMAATRGWIGFHCGAPVVTNPQDATFALADALPDFTSFHAGTYEQPETSATLVLQLRALGTGRSWRLSGPGIQTTTMLQAEGLPADFARLWANNRTRFPCGVDLILCAGDMLAALPRTVMIEEV